MPLFHQFIFWIGQGLHWWIALPWHIWLDQTEKFVHIVAIVVGGVWAYFRFVRGRVYHSRLEPALSGRTFQAGDKSFLVGIASLKNVGASEVDILQEGTGVRVFCCDMLVESKPTRLAGWTRIRTLSVFEQHDWVEAGETIADTFLVVLPSHTVAVKLEMSVTPRKRKVVWFARTIIELPKKDSPEPVTDRRSTQ
jgi:hypothetical protein